MLDILEPILTTSGLSNLFEVKKKEDNTSQSTSWVAYRVKMECQH